MTPNRNGGPQRIPDGSEPSADLGTDVDLDPDAQHYAQQHHRQPHPDPDGGNGNNNGPTEPGNWTRFVKWHPGIGYLQFLADCENPANKSPDERFNAACEQHKWVRCWAVLLDCLLITLVVVAVVAAIGYAAYKIFRPI